MKMNEILMLTLSLVAGLLLGAVFFCVLWWTVRKAVTAKHPALLFLASTLLRMGIALAGFYFVGGGDWIKLLVCLLGFFLARIIVLRLTRSDREANHAP
jgi:F1F0 ATPase subunit 2